MRSINQGAFEKIFASIFVGLTIFLLAPMLTAQVLTETTTVVGRVTDENGGAVAKARISIFPMDQAVSGSLPSATTDEEGRFTIISPAFAGRTRFCAVKESAGYPDTQGLLFESGEDSMPVVNLVPGGQTTVNIHLGAPDGTLEGYVVDGRNHAPISKARIMLRRETPKSIYSGTLPLDGHFFFALPKAPIFITVSAPGYLSWSYKDGAGSNNSLILSSKENRVLTVELTPQ